MTKEQAQELMDKSWYLAKEEGLDDNTSHLRQSEIFEELGGDLREYNELMEIAE